VFFEPTAEELWFHLSVCSLTSVGTVLDRQKSHVCQTMGSSACFWAPAQCPTIAATFVPTAMWGQYWYEKSGARLDQYHERVLGSQSGQPASSSSGDGHVSAMERQLRSTHGLRHESVPHDETTAALDARLERLRPGGFCPTRWVHFVLGRPVVAIDCIHCACVCSHVGTSLNTKLAVPFVHFGDSVDYGFANREPQHRQILMSRSMFQKMLCT